VPPGLSTEEILRNQALIEKYRDTIVSALPPSPFQKLTVSTLGRLDLEDQREPREGGSGEHAALDCHWGDRVLEAESHYHQHDPSAAQPAGS